MLPYFVRNLSFIGLVANLSAKFTSQAKHLIAICRTLRLAIFAVVMLDFWHGITSGSVLVMRFSSKTKYEFISGGKVFLDKGFFYPLEGHFAFLQGHSLCNLFVDFFLLLFTTSLIKFLEKTT